MTDTIPLWLAIPVTLLASGSALYLHWIKPGYQNDRESNDSQN